MSWNSWSSAVSELYNCKLFINYNNFSLSSPLNFLSPTHRYVYAIGFGSFSSEVIGLIFMSSPFDAGSQYANVIIKCE